MNNLCAPLKGADERDSSVPRFALGPVVDPGQDDGTSTFDASGWEASIFGVSGSDVRFGSLADVPGLSSDVCFTLGSGNSRLYDYTP